MAIVSKSNLEVVIVTAKDSDVPVLDNVHVRPDGTTIGAARNLVLAVSPVHSKVKKGLHLKDSELPKSVTIPSESIKKVIKNMPTSKLYGGLLNHCDVRYYAGETVYFDFHDGSREFSIKGKKYPMAYAPYLSILQGAFQNKSGMKIVVNRKRLKLLLDAMEKVCPDSEGESPVFLEFGTNNTIIVRAINMKNSQRAVGVMLTYKIDKDKWLSFTEWERSLLNDSGRNTDSSLSNYSGSRNGSKPHSLQSERRKGGAIKRQKTIKGKKRKYI